MSEMQAALLEDRGVVQVAGAEALPFLQNLVTADIGALAPGEARLAALLSPQGKILFDFLVVRDADTVLLDCRRDVAADLARRLTFYKLRARIDVADRSVDHAVIALWGGAAGEFPALCYADPRFAAMGRRAIVARAEAAAVAKAAGVRLTDLANYHAHRISCGIPEGGLDFAFGDAFPHEACMDQLGGVSFAKGCYVGQEVVSRMEHRGSVRTRMVKVASDGMPVAPGTQIRAGDKTIGIVGSVAGGQGLALIRLDRAAAAAATGLALTANGAQLSLVKPAWARFALTPDDGDTAEQTS